jgi:alpha-D-ribose 1-methylphosphonate 5-triphosphate synthase subunit PhnI
MAYVAARGGEQAIRHAEDLHALLREPLSLKTVRAIEAGLPYLVDRVMGEGSLYAPELAALAIAQSGGDLYEAVLLLRAYRSTQPRLAYAEAIEQHTMLTIRRISAAFKDIPGGQVLGPTLDYSHRLLRLDLLDRAGTPVPAAESAESSAAEQSPEPLDGKLPAVADWQRENGLLGALPAEPPPHPSELPDVTREPVNFPAPRAQRLQALARADTGGVLSLGYASMRGYGLAHPTINELRLAYADVVLRHPVTGTHFSAGRVRVSQAEVANPDYEGAKKGPILPGPLAIKQGAGALKLGFAATLGWNEVKTIAGSMLDLEMNAPEPHPAHREEFVLYHTEAVEASGFCIHYKLPHYVTFASGLDALRSIQSEHSDSGDPATETGKA